MPMHPMSEMDQWTRGRVSRPTRYKLLPIPTPSLCQFLPGHSSHSDRLHASTETQFTASQVTFSSPRSPSETFPTPLQVKGYAEYSASPRCYRGFCQVCGSGVVWRSEDSPEEMEVLTGTLDEDVLLGMYFAFLLSLPGSSSMLVRCLLLLL